MGVHKDIYLGAFVHVDGASCACNLVSEQLMKKFERYIVAGDLAQVKKGHHSCKSLALVEAARFCQPNLTLSSQLSCDRSLHKT